MSNFRGGTLLLQDLTGLSAPVRLSAERSASGEAVPDAPALRLDAPDPGVSAGDTRREEDRAEPLREVGPTAALLSAGTGVNFDGGALKTAAAPAEARPLPSRTEVYRFWNLVYELVARGLGERNVSNGWNHQYRTFTITRDENGTVKRVILSELETGRHNGIPESLTRKITFKQTGPDGSSSIVVDDRGEFTSHRPSEQELEAYKSEFQAWKNYLERQNSRDTAR